VIRLAAVAAGAAALVVLAAPPASADPPVPTNFGSEITAVDPPLPAGVSVRVVGGDSFLELRVEGHEVVVPDYGSTERPYLRFGPDGIVERNASAAATAANEERYGATGEVDADAPVTWEQVASGGTHAWHDHRIHWMAERAPVTDDGLVDLGGPDGTWEVLLVVDGTPTTVRGELRVLDAPSPLPWVLGGALVAGGLLLGVLARGRWRPALMAAAGSALAALGVSAATYLAAPEGAGASVLPMVATALAALLALVAVVGPARARLAATAGAAAALLGWGVLRLDVLTHALVPSGAPVADRGATTLAVAVGLALAIGLLWRPPHPGAPATPDAPAAAR
jgi:hypothetical protein